jgi:AICAR transformylase/IMP cyclohydrolase PurH
MSTDLKQVLLFLGNIFTNLGVPKELAYAENRYQNPAYLIPTGNDPLSMTKFKNVSGNPAYINVADTAQLIQIMSVMTASFYSTFSRIPLICIVGKHGEPCGVAIHWDDPTTAIINALMGNPVAAMGGEVVCNFEIDDISANFLFDSSMMNIGRDKWGLDIIAAPSFADASIDLLGKREKRRLICNPELQNLKLSDDEWIWKPIRGGILVQKANNFILSSTSIESSIGGNLNLDQTSSLIIAQSVCWHANSNTVSLAKNGMLIGLGCGQQDRIECVRLCLSRARGAGHDTKDSFFASDAFFPFATSESKLSVSAVQDLLEGKVFELHHEVKSEDIRKFTIDEIAAKIMQMDNREGPELLIDAGCAGGIVPADGNKFEEVKKLFESNGLSVLFVNKNNRGFAKH